MLQRLRRLFIYVIVTGVLFVAFVGLLVPIIFFQMFEGNKLLNGIFIAMPIVFSVAFVVFLAYYINQRSLINTLQLENQNILGKKSTFNNLYSFQKKSIIASKFRQKQAQHIVAFSFSNLVVAQNVNRNEEIFDLNNFIVSYFEKLPKELNMNPHDFIFGFTRGAFLIYTFKQNEQSLSHICDALSAAIYDYA